MKKIKGYLLLALIIGALALPVYASINKESVQENEGGIAFIHQDFTQALTDAKSKDKLIFVDAYASWCGPCKLMSKKVFNDPEVGDYFNKNFVNVKMMIENGQNVTPEGRDFAMKYKFNAYPTMFFINGKGEVVHKIVGYYNKSEFMKEAKKVLQ